MESPYSSPQSSFPPPPRRQAPGWVMAPAICLLVVAAIDLLMAVYGLVQNLLGMNDANQLPDNFDQMPKSVQDMFLSIQPHAATINITTGALSLICGLLAIWGGICMLRLKGRGWAIAGSIVTMIPCLSFLACCLVGEGIGIWALVVLMRPDVREMFS